MSDRPQFDVAPLGRPLTLDVHVGGKVSSMMRLSHDDRERQTQGGEAGLWK